MATLQRLRRNVLDRFGNPNDIPNWITADWLNTRINDAQREISERLECLQGSAGVSGTSGVRIYSRPDALIRIHAVEWGTSGEIKAKGHDAIRSLGTEWRTATGHPQYWYMEDDRTFAVYPKVAPGSAGTFYCYGPKRAVDLTNNTSPSEIPTALNRAVEEYVCHQIEGVTELPEGKQAGSHLSAYENELGKYRHVRPAEMSFFVGRR